MRYTSVIFDLDGTLSRSAPGITRAAQYALQKMGVAAPDRSKLSFFVGPPLNVVFREQYHMSERDVIQAMRYFKECYDTGSAFETSVYEGIPELLKDLHGQGCLLATASAEPDFLVE